MYKNQRMNEKTRTNMRRIITDNPISNPMKPKSKWLFLSRIIRFSPSTKTD